MADLKSALAYPPVRTQRFLENGDWSDTMPSQWLAEWAHKAPDRPAALAPGGGLSFAELDDGVRRFASGLLAQGFKRGDVIGVQLPNVPAIVIAICGIQAMGGVPALLHMPYRGGELEPLLRHVDARGVVCLAGLEGYDAPALMAEMQIAVPSLEHVIVVGAAAPAGMLAFDDLKAHEPGDIPDPPEPDDPAVVMFTSGTTSAPKAVVHPYRTLVLDGISCGRGFHIDAEQTVLCAPAFTHAFGLIVLMAMLQAGASNAMMPAYAPPVLEETLLRDKVTILFCGPAHVKAGRKAGFFAPVVCENLRRVFIGGAVCLPEVLIGLEEACPGVRVCQTWGMTEVLDIIIGHEDAAQEVRANSIGPVFGDCNARICDPDGVELESGEEGELEIRSPYQFFGYLDNEAANAQSFRPGGWYRTGDLARIDGDGNITVTGRLKDVIVRGGIKINPLDVEELMEAHAAVLQAAMVPVPDEVLGERACLFVVLAPEAALTLDDVKEYLAGAKVAKMFWPERLAIVESMPMTPTRKVIKGRLRVPPE